jgi:hypothetical protein
MDSPDGLIDSSVSSGFERPKSKESKYEDVFIQLTGRSLREE